MFNHFNHSKAGDGCGSFLSIQIIVIIEQMNKIHELLTNISLLQMAFTFVQHTTL